MSFFPPPPNINKIISCNTPVSTELKQWEISYQLERPFCAPQITWLWWMPYDVCHINHKLTIGLFSVWLMYLCVCVWGGGRVDWTDYKVGWFFFFSICRGFSPQVSPGYTTVMHELLSYCWEWYYHHHMMLLLTLWILCDLNSVTILC